MLSDTHTHLYLPRFDNDREEMIGRAFEAGVERLFLPNIDRDSIAPLLELCGRYPGNCFPMLGLHPCSVTKDFRQELDIIREVLDRHTVYAIGEIGIDLYWDKTLLAEQEEAFRIQLRWARELDMPVVIHCRESFTEIWRIIGEEKDSRLPGRLRGIFHCFTGSRDQALEVTGAGFGLGIGGVVTYKNSGLDQVLSSIAPEHIVLETDAPYLAPVPFRGKRNESSYLVHIARKVAGVYGLSEEEIASVTTANSKRIFGI